jgi:hypothetical protein
MQHDMSNSFVITEYRQSTYEIRFIYVKYLGCLIVKLTFTALCVLVTLL